MKPQAVLLSLVLLIGVLALASGCELVASVSKATDSAANLTREFDEAIEKMETQSGDWKAVLTKLEQDIAKDAQSTIKNEVQNTLVRATAAAGSNIKCVMDFVGDRVLEDLRAIKASLTGGTVKRTPKLCQVVPDAVDMSFDPNRRNLITYDGYNFEPGAFKATLRERQSGGLAPVDVTPHVQVQSHYHATLNLGANGVQLGPNSVSIELAFQGGTSTVSVLQRVLPQCQATEVLVPIGSRTIIPPHTKGDREFFAKMDVTLRTSVSLQDNQIVATVYMKAEQYDDDHTTAEGTETYRTPIPNIPQGWRAVSIASATTDDFQWRGDKTWEEDLITRGGLVELYGIIGDTNTEEAGTRTQTTVNFNPVRVRLAQVTDCVP